MGVRNKRDPGGGEINKNPIVPDFQGIVTADSEDIPCR